MSFDTLIKNGTIVDGSGRCAYVADIGITGNRISFIGSADDAPNVIDAAGMYVTPGFIDTHSHADCSAFLYPDCESYLRQGITTFIGGQCGDSNAPIYNWWMRKYWEYDMWNEIDPFIYYPQTIQPVKRVLDVIKRRIGYEIGWRSFSEYAEVVERTGIGCNMITLAGHSQIRADVMGKDGRRAPTQEEMRRMKDHIDDAFAAGAWGISTGRDYPPSAYADIAEIEELARYVKELGGYYFTHWRRTGVRVGTPEKPNKLAGIKEALDLALETGIKTQISHLSTAFDIYPENSCMDSYAAMVTLDVIDDYISRGADVAFDVIPGTSGGICINPHLASLLMPWVRQSGSLAQFISNLGARDYKDKLFRSLAAGEWYSINPLSDPSWDKKIYITESAERGYVGKSIRQTAAEMGTDSLEAVVRLLSADPLTGIMARNKSEEEVSGLLKHERGFVCTDTYSFDLRGTYGSEGEFPELLPHPHTYCAFPKYILSCGDARIEDTIRKITGAPAEFMNIKDRGAIREGCYADLVILNMKELRTNESYIEPRVYPCGVDFVLVNGKTAVDAGSFSGCRAGKILRK